MDQQPSPTPKPKKKSKALKWGVGFVSIFIFLVFIGVLSSLSGNDNSNQPTTTVTPPNVNQQQGTVKGEATEAVENVNVADTEIKEVNSAPVVNVAAENKNTNVQEAKPLEQPTYYENTYGNTVQSPTQYDSRPAGASARCGDGTYSFSQSRRGTCSHHGGVAEWY